MQEENKDFIGTFIEKNFKTVKKICEELAIDIEDIAVKKIQDFDGDFPQEVRQLRFNNYEKRRNKKLDLIFSRLKERKEAKLPRIKSVKCMPSQKESCMDRVKRVRENQMVGFVKYMKENVEKIMQKTNQSERNFRKVCEAREEVIHKHSEAREKKIRKIQILKKKEKKSDVQIFPDVEEKYLKNRMSNSVSVTRNLMSDSLNTTQSLSIIERKLEKSSIRARTFKKNVSISVARLTSLYKPEIKSATDQDYRIKLENILKKQQKTTKIKTDFSEKIISKIRKINEKSLEKSQKTFLKQEKLKKTQERYSNAKSTEITEKLERHKRDKALRLLIVSEKNRIKKENQTDNYFRQKKFIKEDKQKVLMKVLKTRKSSEGNKVVKKEEINLLRSWRDSEIYRLKSKLMLSK